MIVQRAYIYRLDPTPEQEAFLAQTAGACRALYNLALEQRMMWRRERGPITLKSQSGFCCVACGHMANADTNAAKNIIRLGRSRWACGSNRNGGRKQELAHEAAGVAA